jgi:hypothetical protein
MRGAAQRVVRKGAMKASPYLMFWRWLALVCVTGNAIFSIAYERLTPSLPTIAEVSSRYRAFFTPAPYAFAIWGLIYAALIGYAVFALLPRQRLTGWHDAVAPWLTAYSVLGAAWIVAFRHSHITASLSLIVAMFLVGGWMFGLAKRAVWEDVAHPLCSVPFALYFGWISVATIANTMAWMLANDAFSSPESQVGWTLIALISAVFVACVVSRRYSETTYPAVIAWALVAIWVAQQDILPIVANVALVGAVVAGLFSVRNSLWVRRHPFNRNFDVDPHFPPLHGAR